MFEGMMRVTVTVMGAVLMAESVLVMAEEDRPKDERAVARSMLMDLAQELVARSGTSSQVLSLNLTNLIILLVLKGLLLGVATWGAGAWKGRSVSPPSTSLLTEPELVMLVSYLMGDGDGRYDCLLKVACHEPSKAMEYAAGGKMLLRAAKAMNKVINVNPKYEVLLEDLQRSIQTGNEGDKNACDQRYICGSNRRKR